MRHIVSLKLVIVQMMKTLSKTNENILSGTKMSRWFNLLMKKEPYAVGFNAYNAEQSTMETHCRLSSS